MLSLATSLSLKTSGCLVLKCRSANLTSSLHNLQRVFANISIYHIKCILISFTYFPVIHPLKIVDRQKKAIFNYNKIQDICTKMYLLILLASKVHNNNYCFYRSLRRRNERSHLRNVLKRIDPPYERQLSISTIVNISSLLTL